MNFFFFKYHGTGNDFILIDNLKKSLEFDRRQVEDLCHRRFGIGADGLMLIEPSEKAAFKMVYYNSDGGLSTMCGNGGRCIAALSHRLGLSGPEVVFEAADGLHTAIVLPDGTVSLEMSDVHEINFSTDHWVLDTGSPHYVRLVEGLDEMDVEGIGAMIRYSAPFAEQGINVNLAEWDDADLLVRTYERGVEEETMSCGTGVTAAAIALAPLKKERQGVRVLTPGGELHVSFIKDHEQGAREVVLHGAAVLVYEGVWGS
jgi:diaminopimelate epimerase